MTWVQGQGGGRRRASSCRRKLGRLLRFDGAGQADLLQTLRTTTPDCASVEVPLLAAGRRRRFVDGEAIEKGGALKEEAETSAVGG